MTPGALPTMLPSNASSSQPTPRVAVTTVWNLLQCRTSSLRVTSVVICCVSIGHPFSLTHGRPKPYILRWVYLDQVEDANEDDGELRFQHSPLPVSASRGFDFGGQQRHRPSFAHACAILHILHKGPVLVPAQLVEDAAAGEDGLITVIAS